MTPAARVQAAIEILDLVIDSARDNGPPADRIVAAYFKTRRYAGSKDRRAVRELVFQAIRRSAQLPPSGRSVMAGLAMDDAGIASAFGMERGPEPLTPDEPRCAASLVPDWLANDISRALPREEWPVLLERAPLDLRVNVARTTRADMLGHFPQGRARGLSPWAIRLPVDSRIDDHPAFAQGLVEVQDEGSQLVALACRPAAGVTILDLCAGAGGKALALAAAGATVLATDSNKRRLSQLEPRAERAGTPVATRLLDPPGELDQLDDRKGSFDVVLVDAPCSGSGTWRRNPEGRWRLTPGRLETLEQAQTRLLDIAAQLVRPGGALVYAVCSILEREGKDRIDAFLAQRSSWVPDETPIEAGRSTGPGRLLTPGQDETDGFFVARLIRPC